MIGFMWLSDMFKGLSTIQSECNTQYRSDPTGANLCSNSRSGQAQAGLQAIGTGLLVGLIVGHYVWKR